MPANPLRSLRCAVYTRKSTEHGLDQEFNSLDAQREACEAYIKSQASLGWKLLHEHYDDAAYSGGNLERPALKRLLREIQLGRIDVVVVYKIDRLTRSLADFAKLVETFDAHSVSFVAVTQQFNTTTSMGRLTLNILLSFAQFERELASERVKDKVAASRKKGKWTGGTPPLGYDAKNKKLVINKNEAQTIQTIFQLYLECRSFGKLVGELDRRRIVTKRRDTKVAKYRGGIPFTYGPLAYLLKNRVYLGEIHHGGKWFKGSTRHPGPGDLRPRATAAEREPHQARHKILRKRRPTQRQAVRRQRQPDGPELFEQERRAIPVLRQHGSQRTKAQGRVGCTDFGA
jgi:site-specific DNA recombinase